MSFLNTLDIATSALTAERFRMDIISQNLANMDTTRTENGEGPYRRKLTVFREKEMNFKTTLEKEAYRLRAQSEGTTTGGASGSAASLSRQKNANNVGGGVRVEEVIEDESDFIPVYNPTHPDAGEDGYVLMPNVDRAEENVDLMAATRSYETNITVVNLIKTMAMKAAELSK